MIKGFREHKWFLYLLILEILFLLISGAKSITAPLYTNDYGPEEIIFSYAASELISVEEDGSYTISSNGDAPEAAAWTLSNVSLPAGTYHIQVDYHAENIISGETDTRITMTCNSMRNYFSQNIITLSNYLNRSETAILLKQQTDDLNISVYYGGEGSLNITGIHIQEDAMARFGVWFQWFALFVVADIFLALLFFENLLNPTKRQKIIFSLFIIIFASLPMISDTLSNGHDLWFHAARIKAIANELQTGSLPVRIYSDAFNGYGYASPIFYCDILMYFPAVLHLLGIPLFRAYQCYVIFINILTYIIGYKCFSSMFGDKTIGMGCAGLYSLAFYRIICLYTRASVGEYSAMAFYPLAAYGMWAIFSKQNKSEHKNGWIWLSLGMSGVILTHTLSAEMVFIFCLLTCLIFIRKVLTKDIFLQLLKAVTLTIALTFWFLYPFLEYMQGKFNINMDGILNKLGPSGLYISQIFGLFSTYSGSDRLNSMKGEMPLAIGSSLVLCLFLFIWYRVKNGKQDSKVYSLGKVSAILGLIALWFTSIYFPWDSIRNINETLAKYLCIIQFPWRYLAIASILLVITGGCILKIIKENSDIISIRIISVALIIATLIPIGYYYTNYLNTAETIQYISKTDRSFSFDSLYLPVGTQSGSFQDNSILYDTGIIIDKTERNGSVTKITCRNESNTELTIALPLVYYRNYTAKDSHQQPLNIGNGPNNRVSVCIPPGFDDTLIVSFEIPLRWRLAEMISLISLFGLGAGGYISSRRRKSRLRIKKRKES